MPSYKLYYFNSRGRAEHIRYILAYAGVEYEDIRIDKEKWPEYKKKMPFGMVPALQIDNQQLIGQSIAIARYLARKYNLAGANEDEALQCDAFVDSLSDLKQAISQVRKRPSNEEAKSTLMKQTIPFYMDQFEKRLNSTGEYIAGNQVTWADFVFAVSLDNFEVLYGEGSLNKYPLLRKLRDRVNNLPGIKEWISQRPTTEF